MEGGVCLQYRPGFVNWMPAIASVLPQHHQSSLHRDRGYWRRHERHGVRILRLAIRFVVSSEGKPKTPGLHAPQYRVSEYRVSVVPFMVSAGIDLKYACLVISLHDTVSELCASYVLNSNVRSPSFFSVNGILTGVHA